jgi:hypothetical protein
MNSAKVHIMQRESDPLNLRSLPLVPPPEDGWPDVREALERQAQHRRTRRNGIAGLALAASLTLAVGLFLVRAGPVPDPEFHGAPAVADAADDAKQPFQSVASLIALSQQMEARLRVARSQVGTLPTEALIYQVELEDTIALVDEELSMDPKSRALWSQRVNLLLDLDRLYQNQLRRDYYQVASL